MTVKKDDVGEPEARRLRRELIDDELLDQLVDAADERGLSLTGPDGFLPEMIKAVLERGMAAELTDHLGYEKGDLAGRGSGNSRNGTTPKTVAIEVGEVVLDQPRDRSGKEVDIVAELADGRVIALEVKASATYRTEHFTGLRYLRDQLGDRFIAGIVLGTSDQGYQFADRLWGLPISSLWGNAGPAL